MKDMCNVYSLMLRQHHFPLREHVHRYIRKINYHSISRNARSTNNHDSVSPSFNNTGASSLVIKKRRAAISCPARG